MPLSYNTLGRGHPCNHNSIQFNPTIKNNTQNNSLFIEKRMQKGHEVA